MSVWCTNAHFLHVVLFACARVAWYVQGLLLTIIFNKINNHSSSLLTSVKIYNKKSQSGHNSAVVMLNLYNKSMYKSPLIFAITSLLCYLMKGSVRVISHTTRARLSETTAAWKRTNFVRVHPSLTLCNRPMTCYYDFYPTPQIEKHVSLDRSVYSWCEFCAYHCWNKESCHLKQHTNNICIAFYDFF